MEHPMTDSVPVNVELFEKTFEAVRKYKDFNMCDAFNCWGSIAIRSGLFEVYDGEELQISNECFDSIFHCNDNHPLITISKASERWPDCFYAWHKKATDKEFCIQTIKAIVEDYHGPQNWT